MTPKNDRPRIRRLLLGVTAVTATTAVVGCSSDSTSSTSVGLPPYQATDGGEDARAIDAGLVVVGTQVGDAGPVGKIAQDAGPIGDFVQDAGPDVVTVDAGTSVGDAGDGG